MTVFDPVNDRLDVFSSALGTVAEVTGLVLVNRTLAVLGSTFSNQTRRIGACGSITARRVR